MATPTSMGVLLDHTQDKIVVLDEEGRFTYCNRAVERELGWDPETLIGQSTFEYIHPDDVERVRRRFTETIERESFTEITVDHRFRAADGSYRHFESRMSNLTDERLDGYVVSSRDVTDRVEAQRDQRETAERLRELSAATGDVLWMFDADWSELLFVNPAYEEVYGRPVESIEQDPASFLETIHPDDVPAVEEAMAALSAGESVGIEYRVNPDREYGVWVWVQAEPIVQDGEVVRITGFTRDITDRRRRERQLVVMDNLLRHNLRNDLNVITAHADLIEEETPELSHLTRVIRRTGSDLLASAEKQRDLIGYLTGDQTPRRVELVDVVGAAVRRVHETHPEADIDLSLPESLPTLALEELEFAITELVENGVVHSDHPNPHVSVTAAAEPGTETVTVTVADGAPPIPAFEASVLTDDNEMTDVYHSTGLGLWLVYLIVDLSGGRVTVESGEQGNRITITLPRAQSSASNSSSRSS